MNSKIIQFLLIYINSFAEICQGVISQRASFERTSSSMAIHNKMMPLIYDSKRIVLIVTKSKPSEDSFSRDEIMIMVAILMLP
jgi:hypothetical protein